MAQPVLRVYVEKKEGFDAEARGVLRELSDVVGIKGLERVRLLRRYDVQGVPEQDFARVCAAAFSEPQVDRLYYGDVTFADGDVVFAVESLPGQYDQKADAAAQTAAATTGGERPAVRAAKVYALSGGVDAGGAELAKRWIVNPIEAREASFAKPVTLINDIPDAPDVKTVAGFTRLGAAELAALHADMGFAMSADDFAFCQAYFRDDERREPTVTELKLIDTYWSDHCRHTTFLTELTDIEFDTGGGSSGQEAARRAVKDAYGDYIRLRGSLYGGDTAKKPVTLMDIATIAAKELRRRGRLDDLEISDEVNACSIVVDADVGGERQQWLVMFKNETHNHPTEMEPYGGAATCLGGGIRDPLSGRAYVYQAMRVTGGADPRTPVGDTIPGKLPQRKITTTAAAGYSSYGNQVGVASGHVREIYHPGYVAKRMELGATVGAAPKADVRREEPRAGDVVILLGGRTGRDGIGGATGSSREHDERSLATGGAEVQKGNPPIEHMILRLFRDPEATRLILRCNDFGAGGVSVAIGELARGLSIDLDAVPVKYAGLDGTELALSESQERMAVVVAAADAARFIEMAGAENLEATVVAKVTADERLSLNWRGKSVANIARAFLDTNGVRQKTAVRVLPPDLAGVMASNGMGGGGTAAEAKAGAAEAGAPAAGAAKTAAGAVEATRGVFKARWLENLADINVCSQKGLVERFDSTHGGNTALMPFGGKTRRTPVEGMAAKLPVRGGDTTTATLMAFGFDPKLSEASPFHGALYAVVESVARVAALGGDIGRIRLSFQEFFEKPGDDPARWGKPFAALLGALRAQNGFGLAAVGGKDSMSGSFLDIDVPPTLISFAIATASTGDIVSPEFKRAGSDVVMLVPEPDPEYPGAGLPDFPRLARAYGQLRDAVRGGKIAAAYPVRAGGPAAAVTLMCLGNDIGFEFTGLPAEPFKATYGAIVLELAHGVRAGDVFPDSRVMALGRTAETPELIFMSGERISLDEAATAWETTLNGVFPQKSADALSLSSSATSSATAAVTSSASSPVSAASPAVRSAQPRALLLVTPGVNSEYEAAFALERAGASAQMGVVRNLTASALRESEDRIASAIRQCDILVLPGGSHAGDEFDGSGKFAAAFLRRPRLAEAVTELLEKRGGLIYGVGDGFSALLKLGLLPYGKIMDAGHDGPALTFNSIGRFVSRAVDVLVCKNTSPWLASAREGEVYTVPVGHAEGRFVAPEPMLQKLLDGGQIATRYAGPDGRPTMEEPYNPNGSMFAVEGLVSPDGRVFGRMGHTERAAGGTLLNIYGTAAHDVFLSGVKYFQTIA